MIRRAIGKLTGWYMASWVFLLWTLISVSAGAVAMNVADTHVALAAVRGGCR